MNAFANLLAMAVIIGSGVAAFYCLRDVVLALIKRIYALYQDRT